MVERAFLQSGFGFIHYWTMGSGPWLLLLHQAAQSSDEFQAIAPLLARSYSIVSLDYPGHGASDTPGHELSVEEYCEAVTLVLDELGIEKTHILGHHSGGILAVALAVADPDRYGSLVISGVGISDPAVADQVLNNPMTRDLPVDAEGAFLQKTWDVYRKLSAPAVPPETSFLPFITGLKARLRPYDMHYELLRWDYEASWRQLRHRTLLIRGEYDLFSGDVPGLQQELADATFVEIKGGGPWLLYEQPEAIASAVTEFLDE